MRRSGGTEYINFSEIDLRNSNADMQMIWSLVMWTVSCYIYGLYMAIR